MLEVITTQSWLSQTLKAIQISQMIVQALWVNQSHLLQLPHLDESTIKQLNAMGVKNIPDFLSMEDEDR